MVSEKPLGVPVKKMTIFAKASVLPISLILSCAFVFAANIQASETYYEMIPHVVLPQTIQYKPMPTSLSQPGTYTAYTNYPATYTAFPSYFLPYPTQMQSVQQTVYPVTPVAQQPEPVVFPQADPQPQQGTIVILVVPTQQESEPAQSWPKPLETRPVPALPRAIQKKTPVREIDVYAEEEKESDISQMDLRSSIESFLSKKNGTYSLVQWTQPVAPYPAFTPGPFANVNPAQVPAPNPMGTTVPYGFAVNSAVQAPYSPPYANPYPQANTANASASTPGLSQEVLNQIEQLMQKNPNMQFSAVMMGPNGQIIPINGGNPAQQPQQLQQPSQQQVTDPAQQQMQQLQTQMQYIQAMNQYVQRLHAAKTAPAHPHYVGHAQFGGHAPYIQPIPGNPGAYAYANPYYLAMYQSLYGGGYGQQPMPSYGAQPYGYGAYGYGPMFNPYLPTPQGYYGTMPDQKEKTFLERMRERRKKSSDAWRAAHYPEETGMRMPAQNAYPWGYFGAQTAAQETPNYGGYYGMYFGNSTYPGL